MSSGRRMFVSRTTPAQNEHDCSITIIFPC